MLDRQASIVCHNCPMVLGPLTLQLDLEDLGIIMKTMVIQPVEYVPIMNPPSHNGELVRVMIVSWNVVTKHFLGSLVKPVTVGLPSVPKAKMFVKMEMSYQ